jgi:hypothetical protein
MNTKGRCRGNGAQLGNYLLDTKNNIRAELLAMHGATSNDPRRALLEMSLTSEITGKTKDGLYHMQLSPRVHEAADMTFEQKMRAVEIEAEQMGLQGHRWALFEHEKEDGRIHMHLVFERYNHDTGRMWDDFGNYNKHMLASRQMEREFNWQLTHENKRTLDKDVKDHITELWSKSQDGADFVKLMDKAGFEVTQGIDRRPYQIVDQYGREHDLARQLQGIKQREVSEYLNGIRGHLRPTTEASYDRRKAYESVQQEPDHLKILREISESQDVAAAMIDKVKQPVKENEQEKESGTVPAYSFKFEQSLGQPPSLPREVAVPLDDMPEPNNSENLWKISESQDLAMAMFERQQQADRENKVQEVHKQATEQTQPANDNRSPKYYNPVTGQEITQAAYEKMQEFIRRQGQRKQGRKTRDRGGLEY